MTCTRCTAPTAEGIHLCAIDANTLRDVLSQIPDALDMARDTIARLDKVTADSGRGSSEPKSPINLEASKRAALLHEQTVSWARLLLEVDDPTMREVSPVAYLRMSVHVIIRQDWAGDMLDELKDSLRDVMQAVDVPPERVELGPCGDPDCLGIIVGQMGQRNGKKMVDGPAKCRECGARYDGRDVYANLAAKAWHHWCTLAEAVMLVKSIPGAPSRATIYRWAQGHKLWRTVGIGEDRFCPAQIVAKINTPMRNVA